MNQLATIFNLSNSEELLSEEELVGLIAKKLHRIDQEDANALVNLLYRLDVEESKSIEASHSATPYLALAKSIVDRHRKKLQSRKDYPQADWIDIE